jgi:hypothetical protein
MRNILRIKFGSHLYGTSTPASDLDFKSVFVPDARSILLQRAKGVINDQRPKAEFEKNTAGEVEEERFSLQRYLGLLAEGQTVSIDVLFAPGWAAQEEPSWEWRHIVENRHRLLTRKSAAFIGYARKQAAKYGIKGSRVAAARSSLAILDAALSRLGSTAKLGEIAASIESAVEATEHMAIVPITMPGGVVVNHWEVCGRKLPYSSSIKNGRDIMFRLVDEYGHRALQAESNEGVDWKALSHAVRIGQQAIELLSTGEVTFPRPNARDLVAIKTGGRPYSDVSAEIEALFIDVEAAASASALPAEPDLEWIDDFVAEVHKAEIAA